MNQTTALVCKRKRTERGPLLEPACLSISANPSFGLVSVTHELGLYVTAVTPRTLIKFVDIVPYHLLLGGLVIGAIPLHCFPLLFQWSPLLKQFAIN